MLPRQMNENFPKLVRALSKHQSFCILYEHDQGAFFAAGAAAAAAPAAAGHPAVAFEELVMIIR